MKKQLKITAQDLANIHSIAVDSCIQLPSNSEFLRSSNLLAYSWTVAVVTWLNGKNLLDYEVEIDKGVKK